ncbi:DUF3418 domain-containing protein, partial [Salmonella enterica subsp. enterica serovar Typhimurium]
HFDRWWKDARQDAPELLTLTPAVLANRRGIDLADFPDTWPDGEHDFPLVYRYAPDTALDGASLMIPLTALNQVSGTGLDWGIAGYRHELVTMLV